MLILIFFYQLKTLIEKWKINETTSEMTSFNYHTQNSTLTPTSTTTSIKPDEVETITTRANSVTASSQFVEVFVSDLVSLNLTQSTIFTSTSTPAIITEFVTNDDLTTTITSITSKKTTSHRIEEMKQSCRQANVYEPSELTDSTSTLFGYPIVQTVSCYGSKLELRCPPSQLIRIHSAYYGSQLSPPNYCKPEMDSVCYRSMSSDFVILTCENRTECELLVNDRVLGSPCPADSGSSQLFVQYQCLDHNIYEEVASQCTESQMLKFEPICPSLEKLNSIEVNAKSDTKFKINFKNQ